MRILAMMLVSVAGTAGASCAAPHPRCSPAPVGWLEYGQDVPEHRIVIAASVRRDGTILWSGSSIDERQLIANLEQTQTFDPLPYLVVQYEEGASCEQINYFRSLFNTYANCSRGGICSETTGL